MMELKFRREINILVLTATKIYIARLASITMLYEIQPVLGMFGQKPSN